jgi:agmatine/peptidylarginine deiminase
VFEEIGSSPNRVAVIQYNNYQLRTDWFAGTSDMLNFQIRLHETSNEVEIVYGGASNISSGWLAPDRSVQVGLRGSNADNDFSNRTGNNWASTTAGTTSGTTKSFTSTYYPANGQVYSWKPPFYELEPDTITRYLAVNTIKDDMVTLTNNSNSILTINSVTGVPTWLGHSLTTLPVYIPANGSIDIDLTLNASGMAAGTHTTTMVFQTDLGPIPLFVSMRVSTETVPESPRHIAQWEPARGAIISYTTGGNPLGIPDNMIQDFFNNNDDLFVVVAQTNLTTARNHFQGLGIAPNDVTWIIAPTNTYWIRDYGPMSIYHGAHGSRELGILDFSYNRTGRINDNAVNTAICNALGIDYFYVELSMSGGNVLTDGHCMEFADEWVFLQNDTDPDTGNGTGTNADPYDYRYTLTEFLDLVQIFRGELIDGIIHTWPDPISDYINHIDCWAKLLSPTTMLIADGMGGNTETALDAIAAEVETITNCQNQTFNVIRVNCPHNEPYANAYILNDRVYIPFMGTWTGNGWTGTAPASQTDLDALAVFQNAMPGYTVEGYFRRSSGTAWVSTDAVHCRVNTIFKRDDPHVPVELSSFTATISADNFVNLSWVTQFETGVLGYYILRNTESDLGSALTVSELIPATNSSEQQSYIFKDSELYEDGLYYYWLQNSDLDGTIQFHGPVSVEFSTANIAPPTPPLETGLQAIYPNPFNPIAFIPFTLADEANVNFDIYNVKGQLVRNIKVGAKASGRHRIEWDGRDDQGRACSTGVYYIRMDAGNQSFTRKAVLMK